MRIAKPSGYTLVELLVVLAILGTLSAVAMPLAELTVQREKERELKRALWEIRDAIDAYKRARQQGAILGDPATSPYPPTLEALIQPAPDARAGHQGEVLRFLRRIPREPFADAALPPEKTWSLRSYQSEADDPRPGADVYDVYSRSSAVGLNGIPFEALVMCRTQAAPHDVTRTCAGARGFTVIELLVVLAAVGLLLGVAAPRLLQHLDTAREVALKEDLYQMRSAIDKFYGDQSRYPSGLDELVTARYLRELPVDPVTGRADSWVAVSSPDKSVSGVADIRSGARGQARDGSSYANW